MGKQKTIDPKRFYSLGEIVRENLIPGVDHIAKASRIVRNDLIFQKILKAKIVPMGELIQYKVLGANIINYLAQRDNE